MSEETTYVEEYNAVVEALNKYNEGGAKADSAIMSQGFHPEAVVYAAGETAVSGGTAREALFDVIDTSFSPSNSRPAIVFVDIVGDAASARVDTDNFDGHRFTDYFHLLKVAGEWKIIAKTFYTHPDPMNS